MIATGRLGTSAILAVSTLASATACAAPRAGDNIGRAIASAARPGTDRAMDGERHPAELMSFLGVRSGQTIADIWPGDYWDRLFADAVGPRGRVYAVHLIEADLAERTVTPALGSNPLPEHPNLVAVVSSVSSVSLPTRADVIWMRQNYHDLYDRFMGPADVRAFNRAVFRALKPGGRFVVIDHVAPEGSGLAATETTHRIDPAVVKADLAAAGFLFVGESDALRNSADPHTAKVFDASVRGRTDQFVFVFRRP